MNFQKDFDVLFAAILTDWQNQFPEADLSQGSLIYMKSACLASALWGLYKHQEWIATQMFPDTAETQYLEHHAWVRGLSRTVGETDAAYLARLLDYIRRPPAGGNKYDYIKWAETIDNVTAAWCFPLGQGLGTVDVVIMADAAITGSEIPSSHALTGTTTAAATTKLINSGANFLDPANIARVGDIAVNSALMTTAIVTAIDSAMQLSLDTDIFTAAAEGYTLQSLTAQVKEYIDGVRPVTAYAVRVLPPATATQAVTMATTASGSAKIQIAAEITAYINSLAPDETLYLSRLIAIAIDAGASNATISVPAADVVPATYGLIRPGTVTVT
jgi:uncharacterized phage protein gp47/JayE